MGISARFRYICVHTVRHCVVTVARRETGNRSFDTYLHRKRAGDPGTSLNKRPDFSLLKSGAYGCTGLHAFSVTLSKAPLWLCHGYYARKSLGHPGFFYEKAKKYLGLRCPSTLYVLFIRDHPGLNKPKGMREIIRFMSGTV